MAASRSLSTSALCLIHSRLRFGVATYERHDRHTCTGMHAFTCARIGTKPIFLHPHDLRSTRRLLCQTVDWHTKVRETDGLDLEMHALEY